MRVEKDGYGMIFRESGISFIDEGREVSFEDFFRELANMQFAPLNEAEWIQVDENEGSAAVAETKSYAMTTRRMILSNITATSAARK